MRVRQAWRRDVRQAEPHAAALVIALLTLAGMAALGHWAILPGLLVFWLRVRPKGGK